jgi:hypothetical protein
MIVGYSSKSRVPFRYVPTVGESRSRKNNVSLAKKRGSDEQRPATKKTLQCDGSQPEEKDQLDYERAASKANTRSSAPMCLSLLWWDIDHVGGRRRRGNVISNPSLVLKDDQARLPPNE